MKDQHKASLIQMLPCYPLSSPNVQQDQKNQGTCFLKGDNVKQQKEKELVQKRIWKGKHQVNSKWFKIQMLKSPGGSSKLGICPIYRSLLISQSLTALKK